MSLDARAAAHPSAALASSYIPKRWPLLCFGVTFLVYVALVPRFLLYSSPPTGDQVFYLMDTASLVQDGDLDISNNHANHDEDKFYALAPHPPGFVGMEAPYPLMPHPARSTARPSTETYNYHLPGLPVLLVPAWTIGSWFSLWWPATVVFMCVVGSLVALNILLLAHELSGRLWIAAAVWSALAFSNPIMSFSYMIFSELPTGLLVIYAFRRLALGWRANGPIRRLLIGASIAYIPWLAWRCLPIAASLLTYAAFLWWRENRLAGSLVEPRPAAASSLGGGIRDSVPALACVLTPVAVSALLLIRYNLFLFGRLTPPVAVPEIPYGSPFSWPWAGSEEFTQFITTGFALLFDRQMGLLVSTPVYLLAAVGIIAMSRSRRASDRRLLLTMALPVVPYVSLIMAFVFWNGTWCPPARYLTALAPLMAAPLAMSLFALARSWLYRMIYALMALPGFFFMAIRMYDARLLWPANSLFAWLVRAAESPLRINLIDELPTFSPLDDLRLPLNTARLVALSLLAVLVGYILLERQRASHGYRSPYALHGLAWLGALATIGSGWLVVNHEYIKHRTVLTQQVRWDLKVQLNQPLGIAYLDGNIYVTDFRGGSVGVFDTRAGVYKPIAPTSAQEALSYEHPGDVKVGADGLLYVLNNGGGARAMYAMRPDGQVERQIVLSGKSTVATGLSFGPDGKMYVADMVGGGILEYEPDGGNPVVRLGGMTGRFNNVAGVTVDADGMVYAAELGSGRVHQIASDGHFIRTYDLKCQPWYMAADGDWLDTSCNKGLVSINRKSGEIQASIVGPNSPPLESPTGLVYGPDRTLYVLDRSTLVAYSVER